MFYATARPQKRPFNQVPIFRQLSPDDQLRNRIHRHRKRTIEYTQYLQGLIASESSSIALRNECARLLTLSSPLPETDLYMRFLAASNADSNYKVSVEAIEEIYVSLTANTLPPLPPSTFQILKKVVPSSLLPLPLETFQVARTYKGATVAVQEERSLEEEEQLFLKWVESAQLEELNSRILLYIITAFGELGLSHRLDHLLLISLSLQYLYNYFASQLQYSPVEFHKYADLGTLLTKHNLSRFINGYCICQENTKAINIFNYFKSELMHEIAVFHSLLHHYLNSETINDDDFDVILQMLDNLTLKLKEKKAGSTTKLSKHYSDIFKSEITKQFNPYRNATLKPSPIPGQQIDRTTSSSSSQLIKVASPKQNYNSYNRSREDDMTIANINTMNLFFEILKKKNDIMICLEWKKRVKEDFQLKFNESSFITFSEMYANHLLYMYEKYQKFDLSVIKISDLNDLYEEAKSSLTEPSILLFHAFISAFSKCHDSSLMVKVFSEMYETYNIPPSIHTYELLIRGFMIMKDITGVEKVLELAEHDPSGHKPSIALYNEILQLYVTLKQLSNCYEFFQKMKNYYFAKPNQTSYRILLSAFIKLTKNATKIGELYAEMKLYQFYPSAEMYEDMIYLFCDNPDDIYRATSLFDDMRSKNWPVSELLLRKLILACERAHAIEEVESLHTLYQKLFRKKLF